MVKLTYLLIIIMFPLMFYYGAQFPQTPAHVGFAPMSSSMPYYPMPPQMMMVSHAPVYQENLQEKTRGFSKTITQSDLRARRREEKSSNELERRN